MKISEISTGAKAMSGTAIIVGMLVSGIWVLDAKHADKEEFRQFVEDTRCAKARDRYYDVKDRAKKYPKDEEAQQDLERATEERDYQCPAPKKKG